MQLATAILPEEISHAAILLGILPRHQFIEDVHDFVADPGHGRQRDGEQEVVATDVAHESLRAAEPLHHIVQNAGEQPDHLIAMMITVAIVEFLEMIQIGVTGRELLARLNPPAQFGADLAGTGERVDGWTSVSRSLRCSMA